MSDREEIINLYEKGKKLPLGQPYPLVARLSFASLILVLSWFYLIGSIT